MLRRSRQDGARLLNILVADDHPVVRAGLRQMLSRAPGFSVVGEVGDDAELLSWLESKAADVLLLDVSIPGGRFLDVLSALRARYPDLQIIVLTLEPEDPYAVHSLRLGAAGYLSKDCSAGELITAVRTVGAGGQYVSPSLAQRLVMDAARGELSPQPHVLSNRELEILALLGTGKRVREVAAQLSLSSKTVSTYRARLLRKLGLHTTADLIRYALQHGVLSLLIASLPLRMLSVFVLQHV